MVSGCRIPFRFEDLVVEQEGYEIMTVKEAVKYLKPTTHTIYGLISKRKLDKIEISTVDKPNARARIKIMKKDWIDL